MKQRKLTSVVALLLAPTATLACSSDTNKEASASSPTKAGDAGFVDPDFQEAAPLRAPLEADGVQLRQAFTGLPAGKEVHYCQYFVLPDRNVDVGEFQHTYTTGGHHVIVYPTKLTAEDVANDLDVFDCDEKAPSRGESGFAYVGGGTTGSTKYPDGVAWHFEPKAVVILESHMLNTTTDPLDVDYRVNLVYAKGAVKDHVGTIFFYDNNIYLAPASKTTARMDCGIPSDIHVLGLAPHMHVRGVHFETFLTGGELSEPKPLVSSDNWAALEPAQYDPPMTLTAGQRIQFHCDYQNPDPRPILEGPSKTENEMCLLIGSYYPRLDFPFEFCQTKGSGPVFSGTKSCGDAMKCFISAKDDVSAEKCTFDTCEKSSKAFDDFFGCVAQKCFFAGKCQGTPNSPDCGNCPLEQCSAEISACNDTTCE